MKKRIVIIDGDWGGDEMQLAAVLLGRPDLVKIVGATVVFGNTHHDRALKNAGDILYFLKAPNVLVYAGAKGPGDRLSAGDDAHGNDGIGGVTLPPTPAVATTKSADEFILDELRRQSPETVTITATGPLSNIARAFEKDPTTMRRARQVLVMGGCTVDIPASDRPFRRGNITPEAEFNFYMAAEDARAVMESGLPITLLPMNCTHQLTLTSERAAMIETVLATEETAAKAILDMMNAPAELDRMKFGSSPVMHDVHTALYLLYPHFYSGRRGHVEVSVDVANKGGTRVVPDSDGPVVIIDRITDPDALFSVVLQSFAKCLLRALC